MLVTARKEGDVIQIGDDVFITVLEIVQEYGRVPKVKLGIEAPREVPIRVKQEDR